MDKFSKSFISSPSAKFSWESQSDHGDVSCMVLAHLQLPWNLNPAFPYFFFLNLYLFLPHQIFLKKFTICLLGFPGGSEVKTSACNAGDLGSIPGWGRSPGEGNDNPLQYSCLENPMDGGTWWATVHGVAKSRTQLSDLTNYMPLKSQCACHCICL